MPAKTAGFATRLTGLTNGANQIDALTILLRPSVPVSVLVALTAGSPVTGLQIQVTNSSPTEINNGTALWVNPVGVTATLTSTIFVSSAGAGCQLTGVRFVITDGTWAANVVQAD